VEALLNFALAAHVDLAAFLALAMAGLLLLRRHGQRLGLHGLPLRAITLLTMVIVLGGVLAALHSDQIERQRMQAMIGGFAPTYSIASAQAGYARIGLDTAPDDPVYVHLVEQQKQWLRVNRHAHDIYTFHRRPDGAIVLVVDSETDYDRDGRFEGEREQRTAIGEVYEPSPTGKALIERCFAGEETFQGSIETDRWGVWVSAYSPIRGESGEVLAVLGVDYDARDWLHKILGQRLTTLSLFALFLVLIGGGTLLFQMRRVNSARELLALHNTELELANEELRQANELALAAGRAKTQFLANMSHELRTPLTAILGFAEVLLEPEVSADERVQHASTIRRSGQHLLTILSDILDLAKTEAGVVDLHPAPCSPRQLGADLLSMLSAMARGKALELRVDIAAAVPEHVRTDPDRLRQILVNLIGNAIKFTDQGHVLLQVRKIDTMLHFAVIDTGKGIAPSQQQRLFQPFSQLDDSAARRHGGTGLGLVISRRFANMLGGDLTVHSEPGRGSTFLLTLPCVVVTPDQDERREDEDAVTLATSPTLRGRVLLVEDGPDNQRLVGHLLRRAGLEVEIAGNGRIAVDRIGGGERFDLVLMDMQMPELDGYDATRLLRANGLQTPIVALTAHATVHDKKACLDAGCSDYLTKPIDRRRLHATLRQWLSAPAGVEAPPPVG
jgi:two-component system, sensor histidine kinase